MEAARALGAPVVELHTGSYCEAVIEGDPARVAHELGRIVRAAERPAKGREGAAGPARVARALRDASRRRGRAAGCLRRGGGVGDASNRRRGAEQRGGGAESLGVTDTRVFAAGVFAVAL